MEILRRLFRRSASIDSVITPHIVPMRPRHPISRGYKGHFSQINGWTR